MLCPPLATNAQVEKLQSLLSDSVDVSEPDLEGNTPLHLAVKVALGEIIGETPLIEELDAPTLQWSEVASSLGTLLTRRSDALVASHKLHNMEGFTPLHVAVASGNASVCEVLLRSGALVNAYSLRRAWLLYPGAHTQMTCRYWVKRDATGMIDPHQETDQTALHLAVLLLIDGHRPHDDVEVLGTIRLLLKHNADPTALDCRRRTPLQLAVSGSLYEVVELLAASCGQSSSALHLATIRKDVRMVKTLVELGAPVDARGLNGQGDGWTPLCLAARAGAADVARALISGRADVHTPSSNGKTALEIATINKTRKDCRAVLEILQFEMVASVLEIAFRFQHRPPAAPRLAPAPVGPPPEAAPLPPPFSLQACEAADNSQPTVCEGLSLLPATPKEPGLRPILFELSRRPEDFFLFE
jgi:ankyrin repeat protein